MTDIVYEAKCSLALRQKIRRAILDCWPTVPSETRAGVFADEAVLAVCDVFDEALHEDAWANRTQPHGQEHG